MTSSVSVSSTILTLQQLLYSEIGGYFHPANEKHLAELSENSRLSDDVHQLKWWIRREIGKEAEKNTLEKLFNEAIQKWSESRIKDLNHDKDFCSDYMDMIRSMMPGPVPGSIGAAYPEFHSKTISSIHTELDYLSQPPVYENADDDFLLANDGADEQIALLKQWEKEPSSILEVAPRVKAALDFLKVQKESYFEN